jgi:hypothetical protein
MMKDKDFFPDAEKILGVINTNDLADKLAEENLPEKYRIYNIMQRKLYAMLENGMNQIPSATRMEAAPLAVQNLHDYTCAFEKFSVVGPLLDLVFKHQLREIEDHYIVKAEDGQVVVADNCVVERILHQPILAANGSVQHQPTALETSRGILPVGQNTKIILAVGCMPAATLLLNSYPRKDIPNVGEKFAAHYISAITARIRKNHFPFWKELLKFEMAALYLAGADKTSGLTYHAQISVLHDTNPDLFQSIALRYMPDVVSTASIDQLAGSEEYIVFVYALLGELDADNPQNHLLYNGPNEGGADKSANCLLNYSLNENDLKCWALMETAGFESLEKVFAAGGKEVDYWDFSTNGWQKDRYAFRVPGMVHESSVLPCGPEDETSKAAVGFDFAPYGTKNVYVTGSSLWPTGASWNPTMTMCGFAQKLADRLSPAVSAPAQKDSNVDQQESGSR